MQSIEADGSIRNPWRPHDPFVRDALREAAFCELRLIYDSSNDVFLATLDHPEHGQGLGVYKPARGERPLYDFPSSTLHRREVAAFEFAQLLGWPIIPPTVPATGPYGEGSLQLFIEHEPSEHYFRLRDADTYDDQLVRFAAFDLMANNADRKGGHLLRGPDGQVWGIDHGLCFHQSQKVRTVIWDYAGTRLPRAWLHDIRRALGCLPDDDSAAALRDCLTASELGALQRRCEALLADPVLPEMFPYRCVPWPVI
ncbi:MAG: SCO1664 family protein [Chloroflexi bacterium]|nr:SCO1664 family protein [Chloroflexota bacterium]